MKENQEGFGRNYNPVVGHTVSVITSIGIRDAVVMDVENFDRETGEELAMPTVKIRFKGLKEQEAYHDEFAREPRKMYRTLYIKALRNILQGWTS